MMFNIDKKYCRKCQYRGCLSTSLTYCNYASITGETCLKRNRDGSIKDSRGEGPGCLLYLKGDAILTEKDDNQIAYGKKRRRLK